MDDKISKTINMIITNDANKKYFFTNIGKMKNPKIWFCALKNAGLLAPDNLLAIGYIRLLLKEDINQNDEFILLINDWIDCFNNGSIPIVNAILFIEEVIKLDNNQLKDKCRKFLIEQIVNVNNGCHILSTLFYNINLKKFIKEKEDDVYTIIDKITNPEAFDIVSKDVYLLVHVKEECSLFLIQNNNIQFKELIKMRVLSHLQTNPVELQFIDTIDIGYYGFSYSDYIMGFLIDIVNNNSKNENEKLINDFYNYIKKNIKNINFFEKTFIFKIIIYIITNVKKYSLINKIVKQIRWLEELSEIKYAFYHCILKDNIQNWHMICPDFENWLESLNYSESYKNSYTDSSQLKDWENNTKLSILYLFKDSSILYRKLKDDYRYDVHEPTRSFEIKSSITSTNNYLQVIQNASIDEVIQYLNNPEILPNTDFHEIHIQEAIRADFYEDKKKYICGFNQLLADLNNDNDKHIILDLITNSYDQIFINDYSTYMQKILCINGTKTILFYSILSFLEKLATESINIIHNNEREIKLFFRNNLIHITNEKIDSMGGGLNSLSGKCLNILTKISFSKDNTLNDFVENINDYKDYLGNNGLLFLGQYLHLLYKHDAFKRYFLNLSVEKQNISLVSYFKYINFLDDELFDLSIRNNIIEVNEVIFPYINYIFYIFLIDKSNYLLEVISNSLTNKNTLNAICSSINEYNSEIIKREANNKVIKIWDELLKVKFRDEHIGKLINSLNLLDMSNNNEFLILKKTIHMQTLNILTFENHLISKLMELLHMKMYSQVVEIILILTNNTTGDYYMPIQSLDDIIRDLTYAIKITYPESKDFIKLIEELKKINYPVVISR